MNFTKPANLMRDFISGIICGLIMFMPALIVIIWDGI